MKKTILSIFLAIAFLLAGHQANGQERSGELIKIRGSQPLAMLNDTDVPAVCAVLWASGWGNLNNYQFKAAYDTLKLYLEHCYQEPNAADGFSYVDAAVDGWAAGGTGRWPDYLACSLG